jgi:HPt (histidine-containing phosphotransfer) domain-containing protein
MSSRVYDRQAALDRAGGDPDTARRFLDMLRDLLAQTETALSGALSNDDISALRQAAHRLAGAAPYCGATALQEAAQRLERQSREGEPALNAALARELRGQIEAFHHVTAPDTAARR